MCHSLVLRLLFRPVARRFVCRERRLPPFPALFLAVSGPPEAVGTPAALTGNRSSGLCFRSPGASHNLILIIFNFTDETKSSIQTYTQSNNYFK